jgi:hypothetical protein
MWHTCSSEVFVTANFFLFYKFTFINYFKARDTYRILEGKQKERNYLEYLGVKGRVILKWISKKVFFFFGTEQWHPFVKEVM